MDADAGRPAVGIDCKLCAERRTTFDDRVTGGQVSWCLLSPEDAVRQPPGEAWLKGKHHQRSPARFLSIGRETSRVTSLLPRPGGRRFQVNEMRGATAVARAEVRCDDLGIWERERGARPLALEASRARLRPNVKDSRVREKIVDVPKPRLALPAVSRDPGGQAVLSASDVDIVSAWKPERTQRANANGRRAREEKDESVGATIDRLGVFHSSSNLAVKCRRCGA